MASPTHRAAGAVVQLDGGVVPVQRPAAGAHRRTPGALRESAATVMTVPCLPPSITAPGPGDRDRPVPARPPGRRGSRCAAEPRRLVGPRQRIGDAGVGRPVPASSVRPRRGPCLARRRAPERSPRWPRGFRSIRRAQDGAPAGARRRRRSATTTRPPAPPPPAAGRAPVEVAVGRELRDLVVPTIGGVNGSMVMAAMGIELVAELPEPVRIMAEAPGAERRHAGERGGRPPSAPAAPGRGEQRPATAAAPAAGTAARRRTRRRSASSRCSGCSALISAMSPTMPGGIHDHSQALGILGAHQGHPPERQKDGGPSSSAATQQELAASPAERGEDAGGAHHMPPAAACPS